MKHPAVSIIVTVYNTQGYVREALQSLLVQTYRDFELIVVDDGSTDGSLDVLRRLARTDDRLRVFSRPNTGIVGASNDGLAVARGDFVARMDSDDVSLPCRLEHQVDFMKKHSDVVAVSGWYDYMDAKGRRLVTIRMPLEDKDIQRSCLEGVPALCHGCVLIRHDALARVGGYNPAFARATEDLDLFLRLGEIGKLANIPEAVLRVRLHDQSFGQRQRTAQSEMTRLACEQAWRRRGIQGHFTPRAPWRPGADRQSRQEFLMKCGWWAFKSGERRTAAIYGLKAAMVNPLSLAGWRLLACTALKRGGGCG